MKINVFLALTLPLQYLILQVLKSYPDIVEKYYSLGLYKYTAGIEQFLLGRFPLSIGDLLYIILAIAGLYWLIKAIRSRFQPFKKTLLQLLSTLSLFYFLFHFLWGLNYYRLPLDQSLRIKTKYSTRELRHLTHRLVEGTNALQIKLTRDKNEAVAFNFTPKEMNLLAVQGYANAMDKNPKLDFRFKAAKASLFSLPLSYMGFSGYLNPLTNEAQYNAKIPKFSQPTTIAHEMGHQLGYAKENEANFMAALATINHPNPYFNYAGHAFALRHCLADLQRRSPKEAKHIIKEINPGVLKNYREINDFWRAYENPLEPAFKVFYGNYLKVNNQPDGMKSYSYVVALLVNYYQGENKLPPIEREK